MGCREATSRRAARLLLLLTVDLLPVEGATARMDTEREHSSLQSHMLAVVTQYGYYTIETPSEREVALRLVGEGYGSYFTGVAGHSDTFRLGGGPSA